MGIEKLVERQYELMADLWCKEHPGKVLTAPEAEALAIRARMIVDDIRTAQQAERFQ